MTLPFDQIHGEKLSPEQTSYLKGLFAGLANRGLSFSDVAPNPAAAPGKTAVEDLIFEERVKRELHPLDAYPLLLEHANAKRVPDRENLFRFKWNGLFYLSPNKEAYMARLRIPGGQLKTFQWREIAKVAEELTSGYVQITTRANIQIRLIEIQNAPEVLRRIQSVGLHTRGAGADNIRNITANPTTGFDPHELVDVSRHCNELAQIILNDREFYDLPRKFNIAFDNGGLIGTLEDTNDIGARAVAITEGQVPALTAGVYFRIQVGGATGHKAFANDLGVLVPEQELVSVLVAMVRVYIAHGNRTDRKKARLKHLLETWSLEKYLEETEKRLGRKLLRVAPSEASAKPKELPHSHIGVHPQKQMGMHYIGVALPVGQITPKQMLRLADLADNYGSGELRLTVWQNLIIPNIPTGFVETVKKALVRMGLDWQQSNLRGGLVACTGNAHCKFAAANTKRHALELADYLESKVPLDVPVNIHVTGCPNSCAQHYIGDIGLLGATVKVSGETMEGYHVFVGGGFGSKRSVGRQVFTGVSFQQLKPTLEKMLNAYLMRRNEGETFQQFTARHDLNTLQVLFTNAG
ncbi:MAG TPA: NirA family protein [Methylomirabilota bacterium]|nr:NirA family protein [Methylomirabilota bacterium]